MEEQRTSPVQAILRSIEMCPSEESRRKMAGSVLVVGGGLALLGAPGYLQSRLARLANTTPGWQVGRAN